MLKEIFLFRHGENVPGGDYDFPLSDEGFVQCYNAGKNLSAIPSLRAKNILIIASPTLRTKQSAAELAKGILANQPNYIITHKTSSTLCTENGDTRLLQELQHTDDTIDQIILVGHQRPFGLLRNIQSYLDKRYAPDYLATASVKQRNALAETLKTPPEKAELIGYQIGESWKSLSSPNIGSFFYQKRNTAPLTRRKTVSLSCKK